MKMEQQGRLYQSKPEGYDYSNVGDVFVEELDGSLHPLAPRHDLRNHSPDGFAWGYCGSGPAQLALAILADAANDSMALRYYQTYKAEVVSKLPDGSWTIKQTDVLEWLRVRQEAESLPDDGEAMRRKML